MSFEERSKHSIFHLVQFPTSYSTNSKGTLYPTILALHGHGSNEHDLIGLSKFLPENLLWISGRGPVHYAAGAYDWYPVTEFGKPEPALLNNALERIDLFVTELSKTYPIDPKKFFLLGFSQGSMISMSYLLTHPSRLTGVIAQSGYLPLESGLPVDKLGVNGKPIIMTHGYQDSRMPLEWSIQTRDFLISKGVDLEYHNFHMDHEITSESLGVIEKWLKKQIG